MTRKRKYKPLPIDESDTVYQCPCGYRANGDYFDVLGARLGCVWCNVCGAHFETSTGKIVPVVIEGQGVLFV